MIDSIYIYQATIKDKPGVVDLSGYLHSSVPIPVSDHIRHFLDNGDPCGACDLILTSLKGSEKMLVRFGLYPIGNNDVIIFVDSGDSTNYLAFIADAGRWWSLQYSPIHNKLLYKEVI